MDLSPYTDWMPFFLGTGMFLIGVWVGRKHIQEDMGQPPKEREDKEAAFYYRGINFLLADEPDRAIEEFIKFVRFNSETVEIYLSLGNLFRARGEVGRAIRIHQNIIARPSLPPDIRADALYALAEDYRQGGFVDRAVDTFVQVLAADPRYQKAMVGLLSLYENEGRWDKALAILKRMEKLTGTPDPRREAHLLVRLGQDAISQGKGQKESDQEGSDEVPLVTDYLRQAIKVFPGCVEAYRLLGEHHLATGKHKAAIKIFSELMKARPSHFFLLVDSLRRAYTLLGDEKGFEKFMDAAVGNPISSSQLLVRWSQHLEELGQVDGALAVLSAGIARHPGSAELARQYTRLLAAQGRGEEAVGVAHRFLDHLIAKQHLFQCSRCGFKSQDIFWKCPQCQHWDTMEPL